MPAVLKKKISKLSGFSLVEAAVVLGIIGLIVGGIWVAAATVRDKNNIQSLTRDLIFIRKGWEALYQGMPKGTSFIANSLLINAGIIPPNLISSGTNLVTPWGAPLVVRIDGNSCTFNRLYFSVYYQSKAQCINIVRAFAGGQGYMAATQIAYMPEGYYTNGLAFNSAMADAQAHCQSDGSSSNNVLIFSCQPN